MAVHFDIVHARDYQGPRKALAQLCERVSSSLALAEGIACYSVPDRDQHVRVVIGGRQECRKWGVPKAALGFHAVCSNRNFDEQKNEYWYEVAADLEVHINLDAAVEELGRWWNRNQPEDREADLEAWLVTFPHEVLHALEWDRETKGRPPTDIYDEGSTSAIRKTMRAIEDRLRSGRGGASEEDVIEFSARDIIEEIRPPELQELARQSWDDLHVPLTTENKPSF